MLDLKQLKADPEAFKTALGRRGEVQGLDAVLGLSARRNALIAEVETAQQERNRLNQDMKGASPEVIEKNRDALKALSARIKEREQALRDVEERLEQTALMLPNLPADDVPDGDDESHNVEVKKVGTPRTFSFTPRDHVAIGERLGIIDMQRAAKVSGARFSYLVGAGARLHRALAQFMLDVHTTAGDTEFWTPYLVGAAAMTGTAQLPKFEEDMFKVPRGEQAPLYLIPTAEVSLTNYYADEILDEDALPRRICAHTPCFRAEAGSAGRDTRGLIRQHQFDKVEMVRFCKPDDAAAELDAMVERASGILEALELPHRIVLLCAGDMGFAAEKTYDLEVWVPSQDTYREISSCSTFGTFQARRAKIRYRPASTGGKKKPKPKIAATLNGSGLAVGRTFLALLENHQREDGSVAIPPALQSYLGGATEIAPG